MARAKRHPTADAVDAEIRRLMEERERLVAEEDRQRGALLRGYLGGPEADALRGILTRMAEPRDARLFGIAATVRDRGTPRLPRTRHASLVPRRDPEPVTA